VISPTDSHTSAPGSRKSPGTFETEVLVRFRDCDPAGVVFYPRYLEMFNNLVEDWFRDGLHVSFEDLVGLRRWGIPTVHLSVDFVKPSRMGETLRGAMTVRRIGRSSIHLELLFRGPDGSQRLRGKLVLVLTDLNKNRAREIPGDLREKMALYMGEPEGSLS
jgi:4-hydroxybenzoyl-CoA thioesterase